MDTMSSETYIKIISNIAKENKLNDELTSMRKEHDGIYMFFSFDLENSTKFKESFPHNWSYLIEFFYELVKNTFKSNLVNQKILREEDDEQLIFWKIIGDEISFYKKIDSLEEPFYSVKAVDYTLQDVYDQLCSNKDLTDENDKDIIKSNIDIKASIWIAKCETNCNGTKSNKIYVNCFKEYDSRYNELGEKVKELDFLGPDIDEGFRIGKYCGKRKVTVSAKLAYLIYYLSINQKMLFSDIDAKSIKNNFRIVQYKKLKGIWQDRLYPIIFYSHMWDEKSDIFEYDEYFSNDIVKSYNSIKNTDACKIDYVQRIFEDLNKSDEITTIIDEIDKNRKNNLSEVFKLTTRKNYVNSEVHCVAICILDEDKVLMLKRSDSRPRMKGLWECGCAKINSNETWSTCLKKEYKVNIGIDIEVQENPIPIGTFNFTKGKVIVPGIIFKAKIKNIDNIQIDKDKYSEYRLMTMEDINGLSDNCLVNNLKNNIQKVLGEKESLVEV